MTWTTRSALKPIDGQPHESQPLRHGPSPQSPTASPLAGSAGAKRTQVPAALQSTPTRPPFCNSQHTLTWWLAGIAERWPGRMSWSAGLTGTLVFPGETTW